MSVKSLRLRKGWSQEQLAQLSGLNVRTIQRVEKGETVGVETLKSLSAVFEVSFDELTNNELEVHKDLDAIVDTPAISPEKAREKANLKKYFYAFSVFMLVIFLFFILPNYKNGENLGAIVFVFLSFVAMIAALAMFVFDPWGHKWEQKHASKKNTD